MALLEEKIEEMIGLCKSEFGLKVGGKKYSQYQDFLEWQINMHQYPLDYERVKGREGT